MINLRFPNFSLAASAALLLFAGLAARDAGATVTPVSHGTYVDSSGSAQPWTINGAHTLIWDSKPFVPVGGLFQARSWASNATDADYQSDVAALITLKSHNVTDIYVQPARGGLTSVPPQNIQRLIDYLDAQGFTYGISIDDGPRDFLMGYMVRPGAYRQVVPETGGTLRFPIDNVESALYFIVTAQDGEIVSSGKATMVAEGAKVDAPNLPGSFVTFLLPRKVYFGQSSTLGLPNLWDGFDGYRDALIGLFQRVHLGKGFRFFVDPLPPSLTVTGSDVEHFVPTGTGFATEWAEWLGRHYKTVDTLLNAWNVNDRDIREFSQAAALLPLWGGGKGVQAFHDPLSGRNMKVNTQQSSFWTDLNRFKTESVRGYMDDLATALKRSVADVPVVYRSHGYSPLFGDVPGSRGFDGIGIDAYGRRMDLVTRSAGEVYAQAAEASRTLWLPVTATADAPASEKTATGYASRTEMNADFDVLREIGARGFYVDSVRVTDPAHRAFDISRSPEQLGWLSDYARLLVATGVRPAETIPGAVFYPRGLQSASVRPIASPPGSVTWWLPTDRRSQVLDFGPVGRAYSFSEPESGIVYYLFNPHGTRRVSIRIPKASRLPGGPRVAWTASANGEIKHDVLTLTIGPDPVRIVNLASLPVPEEAFPALLAEAHALLKAMQGSNDMQAGRYSTDINSIEHIYSKDNPWPAVQEIEGRIEEMRALVRPYAWIQAERASSHSFDEVSDRAGASEGRVLIADPRPAGAPAPVASYHIVVPKDATYDVWAAASPGAALTFRLDNQPLLDQAVLPRTYGQPYADGTLVWMRMGSATIPHGTHTLEMRANGPAAVDTILLIRGPFTPDGPTPPPVLP